MRNLDYPIPWLLLISSFILIINAQQCDPLKDCNSPYGGLGKLVPDPKDCQKYYACVKNANGQVIPSAQPISCPVGQYFNAAPLSNKGCRPEAISGVCDNNYCGKIGLTNVNCPATCPTVVPAFVASNKSCSTYNVCLAGGQTVEQSCAAPNSFFDGNSLKCVNDSSLCCDFCSPYCTYQYQQIPDPTDCQAYYICFGANEVPPLTYKMVCPVGQYFDAVNGACVTGSCQNGPCSTTGTTTSVVPTTVTTTPAATTTTTEPTTITTTTTTTPSTTTTTTPFPTTTTTPFTTTSTTPSTTTTTTPFTTTTTRPATTTVPVCKPESSFTCPADGYYAQCTTCAKTYFHCVGGVIEVGTCPGTTVFNPVPTYPACIQPTSCPYYP